MQGLFLDLVNELDNSAEKVLTSFTSNNRYRPSPTTAAFSVVKNIRKYYNVLSQILLQILLFLVSGIQFAFVMVNEQIIHVNSKIPGQNARPAFLNTKALKLTNEKEVTGERVRYCA